MICVRKRLRESVKGAGERSKPNGLIRDAQTGSVIPAEVVSISFPILPVLRIKSWGFVMAVPSLGEGYG
jgi:hypothetical protein